jgi:hypothetical protein
MLNPENKIPMKNFTPEQIESFVNWLQSQISHSKDTINESQQACNFGREAMYEGMRDAYMQCLNWFKT